MKYAFAGQLSTADKTALTASSFLALTGELDSINAYFALFDKVTSAGNRNVLPGKPFLRQILLQHVQGRCLAA